MPERYDPPAYLMRNHYAYFDYTYITCLRRYLHVKSEARILRDLLRCMKIMEKDKESTAAAHADAVAGARTAREFQALEEELKRAREESATEKLLRTAGQASREKAEQAADTFLGETKKLQAALSSRDEELSIVHARLLVSEISRVKAERERDTLRAEVQILAEEKDDVVQSKTDLEDDWDLALEAARYCWNRSRV